MKSLMLLALLPCLALSMPQQWRVGGSSSRGDGDGDDGEQTADEKSELIESTVIPVTNVSIAKMTTF